VSTKSGQAHLALFPAFRVTYREMPEESHPDPLLPPRPPPTTRKPFSPSAQPDAQDKEGERTQPLSLFVGTIRSGLAGSGGLVEGRDGNLVATDLRRAFNHSR
jgi:hypothetical protein